jgi:hypothetical protein
MRRTRWFKHFSTTLQSLKEAAGNRHIWWLEFDRNDRWEDADDWLARQRPGLSYRNKGSSVQDIFGAESLYEQ